MSINFMFLIIFAPTVLGAGEAWDGDGSSMDLRLYKRNLVETTTQEAPVNNTVTEKLAPKFTNPSKMYPRTINVAGSLVRFKCKAEGNPTPNITWYKDNEPITRPLIPASYGKWSVSLEELTKSDQGNYTCVVCNELGCIDHTVTLNVEERYPSQPIIKKMQNITASLNETVSFSCEVISDLHSLVFWTWRSPNATEQLKIESDEPNDKPEKLTINTVTANSEGWYKCYAANSFGHDYSEAYLQVLNSNQNHN